MDTDDYFWQPTNPPYTTKRNKYERLELIKQDIERWNNVVISDSLVDWGDDLISLFTLAIRIETETNLILMIILEIYIESFLYFYQSKIEIYVTYI